MEQMHRWPTYPDEKVFGGAGEEPGSQASYWREIEIKRRLYILQKQSLEAQIAATEEQRIATKLQLDAVNEMRTQSRFMLWSVMGAFLTAFVSLVTALVQYGVGN